MILRPATSGDRAIICDSWLESFSESHGAGPLRGDRYFAAYRAEVDGLLSRADVAIAVYDALEDGEDVTGWICWLPPGRHDHKRGRKVEICGCPALLYVFTKHGARGDGVATTLLLHAGIKPSLPFCYGYTTAPLARLIKGDNKRKFGPKWPGGRFDTQFLRHAKR